MTIFVERETGTASKAHYRFDAMEKTIIASIDAQNEYSELVKTQTSEEMLDIKGFVTATNFNIDPLIIDEQWNMMNTRRPDELIVLTPQMLQRLNFLKTPNLIKKLEQLFPASCGEKNEYWGDGVNVSIILLAPSKGSRNTHGGTRTFKQISMTKGAYKQLLMETQTDSAKQVRKYYICLEELFVQYLLYQRAYELSKAERSLKAVVTENKVLSNKLDYVIEQNKEQKNYLENVIKQNEGLSKKLDTLSQILYKESNNKVLDVESAQKKQELVVLQKKDDPQSCIVLRGQKSHLNMQMKRSQEQMHIVGTVETYRNPINLYNLFSEQTKKHKDTRFDVTHNKVTLKNGTTPVELLDVFNSLNDQKYSVAECVKNAL